jgi:hypothetical protein
MNYNDRKIKLINSIDKTIINNIYYFDLFDVESNFYDIYRNTISLYNIKCHESFIDISILFEFLLKNYVKFSNVVNYDKTKSNDSIDVLCYLNVNLFIVQNLNTLLKEINIDDVVMQECLDFKNFNFIDFYENNCNDESVTSKIIGVFNKIIEVHCNIVSKNT